MKKPCSMCPFLKTSLKGWLGERRATEIAQSALSDSTFHCHKTLKGGKIVKTTQPCAGSILLHVKEGRANRYYRFLDHQVTGSEMVFDSTDEFINHHNKNNQ